MTIRQAYVTLKDPSICTFAILFDFGLPTYFVSHAVDSKNVDTWKHILLPVYNFRIPVQLYTILFLHAAPCIFCFVQYIQPPISTWCIGQACSMGSLLLTAGTPGLRHALPHARVMVHQPHGGAQVSFTFTLC